jgi:hypothetical protein
MVGPCGPLAGNSVPDTLHKGWYSGFISDMCRSDEDPPTILECITFWITSAMNYEGGYVKRRVGYIQYTPARLYDASTMVAHHFIFRCPNQLVCKT